MLGGWYLHAEGKFGLHALRHGQAQLLAVAGAPGVGVIAVPPCRASPLVSGAAPSLLVAVTVGRGRRADSVRICAQLYESKPGVVVIVLACSAFGIIPCCQEMPWRRSTACLTLVPTSSATCRTVRDRFIDACFFASVLQAAS